MEIIKYKRLANGKYKIILDNDEELLLYEDVILKYELLLKKDINRKIINNVLEENIKWEIYYTALKSLRSRFKSRLELKKLLLKKAYDDSLIEEVLDKLQEQKYIDDASFCKSYINVQIITTNKGPNKISKELEIKGIDKNIISEQIDEYSKEVQIERINKLINKEIKTNKTRGGNVLKRKIVSDLINLGYDNDLVCDVLDGYTIEVSTDIKKHEYDKLYKRLSKKYEGKELELKIKEKLYQKGLYYE